MKHQPSLYCSRHDKILEATNHGLRPAQTCPDYILESRYWGSYQLDVIGCQFRTKASLRKALLSEKRCLYCVHSRPLTRALRQHLDPASESPGTRDSEVSPQPAGCSTRQP